MLMVCKWHVELSTGVQRVGGGKVLAVHECENALCVWTEEVEENPKPTRLVKVYGTGHRIDEAAVAGYMGTAWVGPFVWHLYEVKPSE